MTKAINYTMKTLFTVLITILTVNIFAQCDKWGADSTMGMQELSIYKEFYKQKNYKDAYSHWQYVFKNAPGARKFTYVDGVKILEYKIKATKDTKKRAALIDTLMLLHDQRIKCFGEEGYVLGRKGIEMVKFKGSEVEEVYNTFDKAVSLTQNETEYYVLEYYFKYVVKAYEKNLIDKKKVLDIYQNVTKITDANSSGKGASKYAEVAQRVGDDFIGAKIVEDCAQAKELFEEGYKANPDDKATLTQMFEVMRSVGCIDDPLFIEVTEKLNTKEPSAKMASFLAKAKASKNELQEAIKYCNQAIELETENDKKAEYYLFMAEIYQKSNQYSAARTNAYKAADLKSGWGDPYLLIGDLYASSGPLCGPGTGFKSQVVTWVAIDMYNKAKSVDASVASKASKKIANYAKYMPTKEDIFLNIPDKKEGDSYEVGCWISQSTTVRAKKM